MRDSAVEVPVLGLTPVARLHSFCVVAFPMRLSVKSAPSMFAPSKRALIKLALVKSASTG